MQIVVVVIFVAVYIGMAVGRWPGLAIDRTGVGLVGAILLFATGAVDGPQILKAIDFSTLAILFSLMVVSAQFEASGFFAWCGARIARAPLAPAVLLATVVGVAGGLSALLTNDVVVWALVPLVAGGVKVRGLDPRPFVIALACAANAGSAATLIGNPQNLLIAQTGGLRFWPFLAACGLPALIALAVTWAVTAWIWRGRWRLAPAGETDPALPPLNRHHLLKAVLATVLLVGIFSLPVAHPPLALAVAAGLLLNRSLGTRRVLGLVDWHLLVLFACLFTVTGALGGCGVLDGLAAGIGRWLGGFAVSLAVSLAGSNTIGNVPLVTLILAVVPGLSHAALYALAVFSTLSGNFLIPGSMANIIAVERARDRGIVVSFVDYAKIGVPVTGLSLAAGWGWLALVGG